MAINFRRADRAGLDFTFEPFGIYMDPGNDRFDHGNYDSGGNSLLLEENSMLIYESECVCCDLPCTGMHKNVPHYYCDQCGEQLESRWDVFEDNGEELCEECYNSRYEE